MLVIALVLGFLSGALLVIGIRFNDVDKRPTLKVYELAGILPQATPRPKEPFTPWNLVRWVSVINKPLVTADARQKLFQNISVGLTPEEYYLIKEMLMLASFLVFPRIMGPDWFFMAVLISMCIGWILPDFVIRSKIKKIKDQIVKQLPDTVDLLGLCVNAGLDFMMALKWVVEKSAPSPLITEMNNVLQEINVGKPRRDALRDLAKKYLLPDLSTFTRTLIQADKMGTSVSEALNILSEDMRLARFRRGEATAMKAPLKMLVPLLFCIFPVVGILVMGPIFLDFIYNNPIKAMSN